MEVSGVYDMRQKRKWFKKLSSYFDWFTKGTYIREIDETSNGIKYHRYVVIKKHLIGHSVLHKVIHGVSGEGVVYDIMIFKDITNAYEESLDKLDILSIIGYAPKREYLWSLGYPFGDIIVKDTLVKDVQNEYGEYFI